MADDLPDGEDAAQLVRCSGEGLMELSESSEG